MSAAMIPAASRAPAPAREDGAKWTAEQIERVAAMWADNKSAAVIAREIGNVTRNAVIGIVNRRGLRRGTEAAAFNRRNAGGKASAERTREMKLVAAKVEHPAPVQHPKPEPAPIVATPKAARLLSMFELRDSTCRFPRWPDQERAPAPDVPAYCGARVPVPGKTPYCELCAVRAFTPREERRRLRV